MPLFARLYCLLVRIFIGNYIPPRGNVERTVISVVLGLLIVADLSLMVILAFNIWCLELADECSLSGLWLFIMVYPFAGIIAPISCASYLCFSIHRIGRLSIKWNILSLINAFLCLVIVAPQSSSVIENILLSATYLIVKIHINICMHSHLSVLESSREGMGWKDLKTIYLVKAPPRVKPPSFAPLVTAFGRSTRST